MIFRTHIYYIYCCNHYIFMTIISAYRKTCGKSRRESGNSPKHFRIATVADNVGVQAGHKHQE